jgi:hypothetical protein
MKNFIDTIIEVVDQKQSNLLHLLNLEKINELISSEDNIDDAMDNILGKFIPLATNEKVFNLPLSYLQDSSVLRLYIMIRNAHFTKFNTTIHEYLENRNNAFRFTKKAMLLICAKVTKVEFNKKNSELMIEIANPYYRTKKEP